MYYRKPLEDIMPDFKKMNENEIRSYIRESESDIEDIEHNYRQEIEYESEQEAEIEREYFQLQNHCPISFKLSCPIIEELPGT